MEGISDRRMTWAGLAAELGVSHDSSDRSVKRAMHERDYGDYIGVETDYLDDKPAARRIKWAGAMLAERPELTTGLMSVSLLLL